MTRSERLRLKIVEIVVALLCISSLVSAIKNEKTQERITTLEERK